MMRYSHYRYMHEKNRIRRHHCAAIISFAFMLFLSACGQNMIVSAEASGKDIVPDNSVPYTEPQTNFGETDGSFGNDTAAGGLFTEQILNGESGNIHFSYYLPDGYDVNREYPLVMTMPGYDMMWFGEDSSGANLNWNGFLCWTKLPEDMIVVSVQLEDWGVTSAEQAIELTEYFIRNFSVDKSRVYAAGYSAGGETMSRAVSMRPDLYAAYLHGASQWDGDYAPVADNGVAVYIFMAENDEYYGSQRARDAYDGLYDAYANAGLSRDDIDQMLKIQTPDNKWFAEHGVTENYHAGGNVVFEEGEILQWITGHGKNLPKN